MPCVSCGQRPSRTLAGEEMCIRDRRMTHADLDPAEGIGLKRFENGSNAAMPACTTLYAGFYGT